MKKILHFFSALFAMLFVTSVAFGQIDDKYPQYISNVANGIWSNTSTWLYVKDGVTDPIAATKVPEPSSYVLIKSGHTIDIQASAQMLGLKIESGGTLKNTTGTPTLSFGATSGVKDTRLHIVNDGLIQSGTTGTNSIRIMQHAGVRELEISGSGINNFGRLYARGGNTDGHIIVNANVNIVEAGNAFTIIDNISGNRKTTDKVKVTINEGKILKTTSSSSFFHWGANPTALTDFGDYTYNINGELDVSLSNAQSYLACASNAESKLQINVGANGVFRLSGKLNYINNEENSSPDNKITINVTEGGVIDATSVSFLNATKKLANNESFIFPLTQKGPLLLTNKSGASNTYAVKLENSNSSTFIDLTKSVNYLWTITPTNAGNFDAKLAWLPSKEGAGFSASAKVLKTSAIDEDWTDLGVTVEPVTEGGYKTLQLSNLSAGGIFTIGERQVVTPLDLLVFEEIKNASSSLTKLRWVTANEQNVSHFELERSLDAINFAKIGEVQTTSEKGTKEYFFTDAKLVGIVYYRLKSIDKNGEISADKVIAIGKSANRLDLNVYPNPIVNTLVVNTNDNSTIKNMKLLNTKGEVVYSSVLGSLGNSSYEINMSDYAAGIYIIIVENNAGKSETRKVIKTN